MNSEIDTTTDTELVTRCLEGNRDAFRSLVERYQSLICSLAYAGCGDLHLSQEIAQETFLAAWRKLRDLHEPAKCKAWLCGIARNLTQSALRKRHRIITAHTEPLDEETAPQSAEVSPHEQTVSREEEAMLWSALEDLPENYREPMILFYRESESVAAVATALDLSEDAVKQRLARGRVMLAEHIERSIRATLRVSAPGKAFTLGVLAAISSLSISAKAASLGATATKSSATAKAAGLCSVLLGPVLILFGNYFSYRIGMESARTDGERSHIRSLFLRLVGLVVGFNGIAALIIWRGLNYPAFTASGFVLLGIGFVAALIWFSILNYRERRALMASRLKTGIPVHETPLWEYRSRLTLFGLPLIHLRFSNSMAWREDPVKAWIAAGDRAFGVLFAFGGFAVAPVSVGGLALGLISWGGGAAGLFAMGGVALGWWSLGGVVFAWNAFGGCALGWHAAMGGIAVARDFALGAFGYAAEANNAIAGQSMHEQAFFRNAEFAGQHMQWLNLFWVLPLLQWWRAMQKRRREQSMTPRATV